MNEHFFDFNAVEKHNREAEIKDLAIWDSKPETFLGYIQENDDVTTWMGTKIGTVALKNTFKNNLGKVITTLRVKGTNDCVYYGAYGSEFGTVCKLRKSRSLKNADAPLKERQRNPPRP